MKNIMIVFFVLISLCLYSQDFLDGTDYAIKVENIIYPNSVLRISSPFYDKGAISISEKPSFSNAKLIKKGDVYYFEPDVVGNYKLLMETTTYDIYKDIMVNRRIAETEAVLSIEFYKALRDKNYPEMSAKIEEIKVNYPETKNMIWYLLDYAKNIEDRNEKIEYYRLIEKRYIMSNSIAKEVYTELYNNLYNEDEKYTYLEKLHNLSEGYEREYILAAYKKDEDIAISDVRNYYLRYLDKEFGKILGDYYRKNGEKEKALVYDRYSNKIEAAKYYYENNKKELLDQFYYELSEEEQKIIENKKLISEKVEILKDYYEKAKESLDEYKFELAQVYYDNILEEKENNRYLKDTYYDLGKLNFIKREYSKSLNYFNYYLNNYADSKDIELRYYLALIYYELNDDEESLKYLNQIIERSPYTVWDTKAKIYMLKISKRRRDG